jgi:methyltransferase family protein
MLASARRLARRLARAVVRPPYRGQVRQTYNQLTWWLFVGRRYECPCCGGRFRKFRVYETESGRREAMCPKCGALGRHRVDWLFIRDRTDLHRGDKNVRLLHVAPEYALQQRLVQLPNVSYVSADLYSVMAMERMDITDIRFEQGSFDAIVCNHVLEHVPDDRKALSELHRVLRPGGWAMLQAPVDRKLEATLEDPTVTDAAQRLRLYGQRDHVRLYGRDYSQRLEEAGFSVSVEPYVKTLAPSLVERYVLDLAEEIYFCRKL